MASQISYKSNKNRQKKLTARAIVPSSPSNYPGHGPAAASSRARASTDHTPQRLELSLGTLKVLVCIRELERGLSELAEEVRAERRCPVCCGAGAVRSPQCGAGPARGRAAWVRRAAVRRRLNARRRRTLDGPSLPGCRGCGARRRRWVAVFGRGIVLNQTHTSRQIDHDTHVRPRRSYLSRS